MPINNWLSDNSNVLLGLSAGLLGGKTAADQMGQGLQNAASVATGNKRRNKTMEFLQQMNPELAAAVEAGALSPLDAYKTHVQSQQPKKPNLMNAGGSLYNADTGEWISPPAGAGNDAEYGLVPVWGQNAAGETVLGQLSKNGTFQQTQMPEGFQPTPGIMNQDLGTSIRSVNSKTGGVVSQTPKDLAGAEREKELGSVVGKNIAAAPGDLQAGQNAKALIQELKTDPNRERGTGFSSLANSIPGTAGYDYENKVSQAKSGAFLTAIQQMRGLGALSNSEGSAATAAVTRMDTATSEKAFTDALNDYEKIIDQGIARAQSRLGSGQVQQPMPGSTGQTKSGVSWSIEP